MYKLTWEIRKRSEYRSVGSTIHSFFLFKVAYFIFRVYPFLNPKIENKWIFLLLAFTFWLCNGNLKINFAWP